MIEIRSLQKSLLLPHIVIGGTAADFTMGNGNDTLWLSEAVGQSGHVYAFDIQPDAVESTAEMLKENAAFNNYTLINDSHAECKKYIDSPICVGMFNLGWLPGSDRSVTTKCSSTVAAVGSAIDLLAAGGGLTVAVYPGHDEGRKEGEQLDRLLEKYDCGIVSVTKVRIINAPTAPYFYLIEKNLKPHSTLPTKRS